MSLINAIKSANNTESFYKEASQISGWLKNHNITDYKLVSDEVYGFTVHVEREVNIGSKNLKTIPVKFSYIKDSLNCSFNNLQSLEFCPTIVGGDFDCSFNRLISLSGCPEIIKGNMTYSGNRLIPMQFIPKKIDGNLIFYDNDLIKSEFCPENIFDTVCFELNPRLGLIENLKIFQEWQDECLRIQAIINFEEKLNLELVKSVDIKSSKI